MNTEVRTTRIDRTPLLEGLSLRSKLLLLTFTLLLTSLLFASWIFYQHIRAITLDNAYAKHTQSLQYLSTAFNNYFRQLEGKLDVLSETPPIQGLIRASLNQGIDPLDNSTAQLWQSRLQAIFAAFLQANPTISQVRYIGFGDNGKEIIRVDQKGSTIIITPDDQLQQKENEPYFLQAKRLEHDEITYSDITLNREYGAVDRPNTFMLRVFKKVYDIRGEPFGFVILNIDHRLFLESFLESYPAAETLNLHLVDPIETIYNNLNIPLNGHSEFSVLSSGIENTLKQLHKNTETKNQTAKQNSLIFSSVSLYPYSRSSALPYTFILVETETQLLAKALDIRSDSIFLVGIVIAICLFIAWALTQKLLTPLTRLARAIREYPSQQQNLQSRNYAKDEIGLLAFTLSDTFSRLEEFREIEARAIAETKTQARLKAIFNSSFDAIALIDEQGTIKTINTSLTNTFGYQSEELLNKNISLLMPEPFRSHHDNYLKNYLSTGERKIIGTIREVKGLHKNGDIFPIELSISELTIDGEVHFVGMIRDISERNHHIAKILQLVEELKSSNKELDDFAYIASHDLREPLRGIQIHSHKLLKNQTDNLDEDGIRRIRRVIELGERLDKLVSDLLYYSRLGRAELHYTDVSLDEIISNIQSILKDTLIKRNAKVQLLNPVALLYCDPTQIQSALLNLITNAVKYNDQNEILIEVGILDKSSDETNSNNVTLFVRDNGIGIDPIFHKEIFRIFKRLNHEDAYGYGTGGGLTFVKKAIDKHNGKIWVESALGKGSTFYFTLPTKQEKA